MATGVAAAICAFPVTTALMTSVLMTNILMADEGRVRAEPRIVGYLPDYRLADYQPERLNGVTDLVAFSATLDAEGRIDRSRIPQAQLDRLRVWKRDLRLRLLLCVGGWDRSQGFAKVSAEKTLRAKFVEQAVRVCLEERFDGLDLDWEHPEGAEQQQSYSQLLIDLRQAFDVRGLQLSMAVAPWQHLPVEGWRAPHKIHLMAYDNPERHATLADARAAIDKLLAAGVQADQIVLGVPFYGRGVQNRELVKTWGQIVSENPSPATDQIGDLYFNGPQTIAAKARLARERGLAGIMVWELGQDATGPQSLISVIRRELDGRK